MNWLDLSIRIGQAVAAASIILTAVLICLGIRDYMNEKKMLEEKTEEKPS